MTLNLNLDFSEYACGKLTRDVPASDLWNLGDGDPYGSVDVVKRKQSQWIRPFLSSIQNSEQRTKDEFARRIKHKVADWNHQDTEISGKVVDWYSACLATPSEDKAAEELKKLAQRLWDVSDPANKDWMAKLMAEINDLDGHPMVQLDVRGQRDGTKPILKPGLRLMPSLIFPLHWDQASKAKLIGDVVEQYLTWASPTNGKIKLSKELFDFHHQLKQNMNASPAELDVWSLDTLEKELPGFPWNHWITKRMASSSVPWKHEDKIEIVNLDYFKKWHQMLSNPAHTEKLRVCMILHLLLTRYLPYSPTLPGVPTWSPLREDAPEFCSSVASRVFLPWIIRWQPRGNLASCQTLVDSMGAQLKAELKARLKAMPNSKLQGREVKEKLRRIQWTVVEPQTILNKDRIYELYQELQFKQDNFLKNMEVYHKMRAHLPFLGLNPNHPLVNPWVEFSGRNIVRYDGRNEVIYLNSYFMTAPLVYLEGEEALRWGTLRVAMATELFRGIGPFDPTILEEKPISWPIGAWKTPLDCLTEDYRAIFHSQAPNVDASNPLGPGSPGMNPPVQLSQSQVQASGLSDLAGLELAWNLFQQLPSQDRTLDGTRFTATQLFFVALAQSHCQSRTQDQVLSALQREFKAPDYARTWSQLRHSVSFHTAFQCSRVNLHSLMNPAKECVVFRK
jgi:hypothetical protein